MSGTREILTSPTQSKDANMLVHGGPPLADLLAHAEQGLDVLGDVAPLGAPLGGGLLLLGRVCWHPRGADGLALEEVWHQHQGTRVSGQAICPLDALRGRAEDVVDEYDG